MTRRLAWISVLFVSLCTGLVGAAKGRVEKALAPGDSFTVHLKKDTPVDI